MKKIKIINDPVGGFVRIWDDLFLQIIDHPYFQRLRRIRQLGMTDLVFPGAVHTRFQHALGAFQLMNDAIETLRVKGVEISEEEHRAVCIAILLHDIGHGPFSHALEQEIVENVDHEQLSLIFMNELNSQFDGKLTFALDIYQDNYPRRFLHQLISSQLDLDRMDYLRRDSFYTGVREGLSGSERLISMMNVKNDKLVIEQKGIYSIENFLLARRFMYWQVYLHKTVINAEMILVHILGRAKELARSKRLIFCSPALHHFLYTDVEQEHFKDSKVLDKFAALDDNDILQAIKVWTLEKDFVLAALSSFLTERKLLKIEFSNQPFDLSDIKIKMDKTSSSYRINTSLTHYFVYSDSVSNSLYDAHGEKIQVLLKNDEVVDLENASLDFNSALLSDPVQKFFLCYPSEILN